MKPRRPAVVRSTDHDTIDMVLRAMRPRTKEVQECGGIALGPLALCSRCNFIVSTSDRICRRNLSAPAPEAADTEGERDG